MAPSRTQSSLGVSADGTRWILLNASPDLRQQINERPQLHPRPEAPVRSSPIEAVILTGADVDEVAGLLVLRERQPLAVYAHPRTTEALKTNRIFNVLNPGFVEWRALELDRWVELRDSAGAALGLSVRPVAVPGKVALWLEDADRPGFGTELGDSIGLEIKDAHSPPFFYIPGCAGMTPELAQRLKDAELVFFDGTLWRDDEMIVQGVGTKTGARMGHMSCSGPDGAMAALASLGVRRKIFTHINNTNPLVLLGSPERSEAEKAGWDIAYDGMELSW